MLLMLFDLVQYLSAWVHSDVDMYITAFRQSLESFTCTCSDRQKRSVHFNFRLKKSDRCTATTYAYC